jgi:hypothetical protein
MKKTDGHWIRHAKPGVPWLAAILMLAGQGHPQRPDFYVFLAFGQSNMEGGPPVAGTDQVFPRFRLMQAVDCPGLNPPRAKGIWYAAVPPTSRCNQGPGIAYWFGRDMMDNLPANVKIGIINVAVAGCKIELFDKDSDEAYVDTAGTWLKGVAAEYGGSPYDRMVEVARAAQKDGVIKGMILHQGESNVGDEKWPDKVKGIYGDLMEDLNLDPGQVPLVAGEVVNEDVGGAAASMNAIIARLPTVLPNSYVVSTKNLGSPSPDKLHFNADGYRELGRRYAAAMLAPLAKPVETKPKPSGPGYDLEPVRRDPGTGDAAVVFAIPRRTFVSVKAYTLEGKEIAELAGREYPAGRHALGAGGKAFPKSLCVLRMRADAFTATHKVIVETH